MKICEKILCLNCYAKDCHCDKKQYQFFKFMYLNNYNTHILPIPLWKLIHSYAHGPFTDKDIKYIISGGIYSEAQQEIKQ